MRGVNMDDLVRRQDLLDILANSSDSWAAGIPGNSTWWAHSVRVKDNILREIEKLEAVPEASVDKLTELLVADGHRVNARSLAEYILNNCALFATNHLPLEMKTRNDCSTLEYCKGWNDAVKQMAASNLQAMPCKVGDKLWMALDVVEPVEVSSVSFGKNGCVIELSQDGALYGAIAPEDIGKYAFFLEEEAFADVEARLKVVDEVLGEAASKCEEVNNGARKEAPTKNPLYDHRRWGSRADWAEEESWRDEADYDLY